MKIFLLAHMRILCRIIHKEEILKIWLGFCHASCNVSFIIRLHFFFLNKRGPLHFYFLSRVIFVSQKKKSCVIFLYFLRLIQTFRSRPILKIDSESSQPTAKGNRLPNVTLLLITGGGN